MDVRVLTMRPPLRDGGHGFVQIDESEAMWQCVHCGGCVPQWAITERFVTTLLGRWCPGLMAALPPGGNP